jgi:hypothetical protein
MQRFLAGWARVGQVSIGPTSGPTVIGDLTLPAGADTIWVRAQQLGGDSPWPYGYGLLTWKTAAGRELGTVKCWGHTEGEVLRLGVGLEPGEHAGQLVFEPRAWNLAWVKAGAPNWQLAFDQQSGVSGGGGSTPPAGYAASFAMSNGTGLALARVVFP